MADKLACPLCKSEKLKDIDRIGCTEIAYVCQGCKTCLLLDFTNGVWHKVTEKGITLIGGP